MTRPDLPQEWDPVISHMMVYEQGPQITVLVDPDHPEIWMREPYRSQLQHWAIEGDGEGRYVIVFCGDDVSKIEAIDPLANSDKL